MWSNSSLQNNFVSNLPVYLYVKNIPIKVNARKLTFPVYSLIHFKIRKYIGSFGLSGAIGNISCCLEPQCKHNALPT